VPIRLAYDRWVDKYTEASAAGLADLKHDLEANVVKVFEIYMSGLKTWLETGQVLSTPGLLVYGGTQ
jgi:hypothetical protein